MARDEHGMPVPHEESPLPWREHSGGIEADDESWVLEDEFLADQDLHFSIHAANWIIPCREIVRRLADFDCYMDIQESDVRGIIADAANLWAEMQRDAKGGDQ